MKVQDKQNGPSGLPEKTGWLRAWELVSDTGSTSICSACKDNEQPRAKVKEETIRDLLFADNCAVNAVAQ